MSNTGSYWFDVAMEHFGKYYPARLYTGDPMPNGEPLLRKSADEGGLVSLDDQVHPDDLIEGSGRQGEPKALGSSLRMRPGDQRLPTPNGLPHIHDLVVEDIKQRKALGVGRYGTPLQPHNGRDSWRDAYEEMLDFICYFRQMIEERDNA